MCGMKKQDKELLQNIDRLLAGEDIKPDEMTDNELKSAAKFMKKLVLLKVMPDEEFKAKLKEKLLRQIKEKQIKETEINHMITERYTTRRPSWRLALLLLVLLAVAIAILWAKGVFGCGY